jgi:hypothetical protein
MNQINHHHFNIFIFIYFNIEAGNITFSPIDFVNPMVGTQSTYGQSTGITYPVIASPLGMNAWIPQT